MCLCKPNADWAKLRIMHAQARLALRQAQTTVRSDIIRRRSQMRQQTVQNRQRMRRATGNEQVDRQQGRRAVVDFGMIHVQPAGNRAGAHRDHQFRPGHGVVRLLEGEPHVLGTGPVINSPSA